MNIDIFEVQFDKDAGLVIPAQEQAVIRHLTTSPGDQTTDVVVLSHGWNNDMDQARTLYRAFLKNLAQTLPAGRRVTALGILWPSKKFADEDLIPGGAASFDSDEILDRSLRGQLEAMKSLFGSFEADERLDRLAALLPALEVDPAAQREFVRKLGELLETHRDIAQTSEEEGSARLVDEDGAKLLSDLSVAGAATPSVDVEAGGGAIEAFGAASPAAGGAAGIGSFFGKIKDGAAKLLNLTTYYVMKDRAGKVGRDGVNPMLSRIQARVPHGMRFHLIGHSFGGRLVTAAVDGPQRLRVHTLLLLQAAYSHNGLASNFDGKGHNGFFHRVLADKKVSGPILITHSKHDKAVGKAYPAAARLNGDNAAAFGGPDDVFGGMGANGAQHVEAVKVDLAPVNTPYNFQVVGKSVFNLNGDRFISDHGDVARPETAYALAAAMASP